MYKNIIISALGAVLTIRSMPDLAACEFRVQIAAFAGFFISLIIFCFFCDNLAEKWRNRERDERKLAEYIRNLKQ